MNVNARGNYDDRREKRATANKNDELWLKKLAMVGKFMAMNIKLSFTVVENEWSQISQDFGQFFCFETATCCFEVWEVPEII